MNRLIALLMLATMLAACGESPTVPRATPAPSTPAATIATTVPTVAPPTTPPTAAPTATQASPTATSVPPSPTTAPATATATATSVPPAATVTRPLPTPFPVAKVLSFTANPTTTNAIGDQITFTWQATGQQAQLCPLFGPGPVDSQCVDVPLSGTRMITVTEADLQWVGYVLRARSGGLSELASVRVFMQCRGFREWFMANPPLRCPVNTAQFSQAAFQRFDHGFMVWTAQPDAFTVFNDGTPQTVDTYTAVRLKPGASPDNRTGETPPAGRFEPLSGFGMLWRGEFVDVPAARARLGWALEREYAFTSGHQCELTAYPRLWNCYLGGPNEKVYLMRPDSTAGVNVLWSEFGTR
ncbi:MAG: hypothetical protein HZB53_20910 [Chloroflexi bacterium]|nr:hypothetical protein [Chloroflexota bacterium]